MAAVRIDPTAASECSSQPSSPKCCDDRLSPPSLPAGVPAVLQREDVAISMDGRGAWRDNVFVERLWRSVKYEEVYLRAYGSVSEARTSIGRYFTFHNARRPHSSLDRRAPDHVYFNLPLLAAA
jgi:transposase InsO family protein